MLENSMLNDLLFDPAYLIVGLGAVTLLLFIMVIVCLVKLGGLKKKYKKFMEGSDAKSLEELIQTEVEDIKKLQQRYEFRPTILTTNQPFSKWTDVFGDAVIANAIIDRLVHHCEVIKITGNSYRIKGRKIFEDSDD